MSLLDRLRARTTGTRAATRASVDLTGNQRLAVVGESHYQPALAAVAGPKRAGGVEVVVQAVLAAEPNNPYDSHAVAVHLVGGGKVGYLSREDAIRYFPVVARHAGSDLTATCEAVVLGGDARRKTQFCVWLHISQP
jgi:hypothetical protein